MDTYCGYFKGCCFVNTETDRSDGHPVFLSCVLLSHPSFGAPNFLSLLLAVIFFALWYVSELNKFSFNSIAVVYVLTASCV